MKLLLFALSLLVDLDVVLSQVNEPLFSIFKQNKLDKSKPSFNLKPDLGLLDEKGASLSEEFNTGSFYWYGTDNAGSPNLWYRMERMEWEKVVLHKRIEYTNLVLESALEVLPSHIEGINFILLVDEIQPVHLIKHPRLGPKFLKSFVERCPGNKLKKAIMVTGKTGNVFYNIAKAVGPKHIVEKIILTNDRKSAASKLLDFGIIADEESIPPFLEGNGEDHPDHASKDLRGMISLLYEELLERRN